MFKIQPISRSLLACGLQICFIKCITYMYCGVILAIALRPAIKFIDCSTDLKLQLWVLDTYGRQSYFCSTLARHILACLLIVTTTVFLAQVFTALWPCFSCPCFRCSLALSYQTPRQYLKASAPITIPLSPLSIL